MSGHPSALQTNDSDRKTRLEELASIFGVPTYAWEIATNNYENKYQALSLFEADNLLKTSSVGSEGWYEAKLLLEDLYQTQIEKTDTFPTARGLFKQIPEALVETKESAFIKALALAKSEEEFKNLLSSLDKGRRRYMLTLQKIVEVFG